MQGYIRPRNEKKTCWELSWYDGHKPNGKPDRKFKSFKGSEREAHKELRRILCEIDRGEYITPSDMTLTSYFEYWMESTRTSRSLLTNQEYDKIINKHICPALGKWKISQIKPLHIQDYYTYALRAKDDNGKGLSAQTVLHHHTLIHKALQDAVKWQIIARNPSDSVESPKVIRTEKAIYTKEQIKAFLETAKGTAYYLPILLCIATGMRRNEVLALWWSDYDAETGYIYLNRAFEQTKSGLIYKEPKTAKSRRAICLPPMIRKDIMVQKEQQKINLAKYGEKYHDSDLICTQANGKPITPQLMSNGFHRMLDKVKIGDKVGLPHTPFHNLRHTHATILFQEGIHPKIVQERLGHSNIATTLDIYSHMIPTMQKDAADKIDDFLS